MLTAKQMTGVDIANGGDDYAVEYKPAFHEWASVLPGMICLARKKKTQVFRQYQAAETACPVIACAAGLEAGLENNYFFAGIARSKSVRTPDDGQGPTTDEFFTLSLGGMVTLLNNSGTPIHAGDLLEWCFVTPNNATGNPHKRQKSGPRRFGVKLASVSSDKIIGRALSYAALHFLNTTL